MMHGLVLRAIQMFVQDLYGPDVWSNVVNRAGTEITEFEPMLPYDLDTALSVLQALGTVLNRPQQDILEDIGTYLVSHPNVEAVRRLLRFCGVNFVEFLHSLDDLPGRARLAVPDLELPVIQVRQKSESLYTVTCKSDQMHGFGHVLIGIMRTMADDYGALVVLDHAGGGQGLETLTVSLVQSTYAEGRSFQLGARAS